MPNCELSIVLDEANNDNFGGDFISGHVQVSVDKDVRCDGLSVGLLWRTHGHGDPHDVIEAESLLFQGAWQVGMPHAYSFTFTLPGGPLTHQGRLVNVSWFIVAKAALPEMDGPKVEREFALVKGSATALKRDMTLRRLQWNGWNIEETLPGLRAALSRWIAEIQFGKITTRLSSTRLIVGESFSVFIYLKSRYEREVNLISVGLVGAEIAEQDRHVFYRDEVVIVKSMSMVAGQRFEDDVRIMVPQQGAVPMSLSVADKAIQWHVVICVEVDGMPEFERQIPVVLGD